MRAFLVLLAGSALASAWPAAAQDAASGEPPERIDLTITQAPPPVSEAECERRRQAAIISGEIIVCGNRPNEGPPQNYSASRKEAQDRYAAETRGRDPVQLPELGIFKGPATLGGICVKGVFNCPKPPALIVDVASLPQAPAGSDADRIGRGLEPLGEDNRAAAARQMAARQRAEMGLPEPGAEAVEAGAVSPAGSAVPAAPR